MNSKVNQKMYIVIVLGIVIGMAGDAKADFTFGTPVNLGPTVNSSAADHNPSISSDGLSLYFSSYRPGGSGDTDVWVTTRETTDDPWGEAVNLGPTINSSGNDGGPSISPDGCTLVFNSSRTGGYGSLDIWVTRRATRSDDWGPPLNLGPPVNSSTQEMAPNISFDGLHLFFSDYTGGLRPGGLGQRDLWTSSRQKVTDPWEIPVNLGSTVNSSAHDQTPSISADGLMLFIASNRSGGLGNMDIWVSTRTTKDDPWTVPVNLGAKVNSSSNEVGPCISADGRTLFFHSERSGGFGILDIWQVSIEPIVDLNDDGIVNADDMCIMIDHWGQNYSLCDIGPMPWGDGIVDIQDLIVLAEHLFEDYRLIAHWNLDEEAGVIAYDSVGENNAVLYGGPIWQPTGGRVGGALDLDGIDDYISTPFIIDPARQYLSAFVWIKGGEPGQVIISRVGDSGETWLGIDSSEGKLITGLCDVYFDPLESEAVITDGQWHHVGLVYDLTVFHRRLYVDGALVVEDTSGVAGVSSDGGLYIGASKDLEASSFFSGLIDDVRIYNGVLSIEEIDALAQ